MISNVHELDKYAALHDDKDRGDDNADHDGMADDTNTDEDRDYYYDSGCCNDNDGYTHSIVGGDANTGVDHIAYNNDIDGWADMEDDDVYCDNDGDAGVDGVIWWGTTESW